MRRQLAVLREKADMTQEEVANVVGISRSYYGLIESGDRNPTYGLAKKIAAIFSVKLEDIFLDLDSFRMKLKVHDERAAPLNATGTEGSGPAGG